MNTSDRSGDELSDSILFGKKKPAVVDGFPFLAPALSPGELGWLGDFRVLRVLGKGGMGIVFEAEDTALHRTVALKVLRPELCTDPESRERFVREARAAAALESEHVVTIYQVGKIEQTPFMAMQLLHGISLQDRLERPPRLAVKTALTIARQAAVGLAAAHARGLIHRDIKPANLWLESDADDGSFERVKVLDFGLARRVTGHAGLTATGIVLGTPNYMAPEQADGTEIDHRADLFSLGCVMYATLTGELAFPGQSTMSVFHALATRTPPSVRELNPAVPAAASDLVARLLAKEPADRPQTANEVMAVLDGVLTGLSAAGSDVPPAALNDTIGPSAPSSRREPSAARADTPASRHWWPIGAGIAAALALLGVVGWQAFRPGSGKSAAAPTGEPIKVGVLHSQTGPMFVSEPAVIDATMLAIDELNRGGGVLGRPVEPVPADGASDPARFAQQAEKLLAQDKVAVIFGCWTSASRKAVRPVVERENGLLFYPVQYEGLEESPRIVYLGPTPNQQLLPAVDFLTGELKKTRLFLVGSDYVFPRAAHAIIKDRVKQLPGVAVVGETYLPLDSKDVSAVVRAITDAKPDAIMNTINGSTNIHFFRELRKDTSPTDRVPVLSVSITENELKGLEPGTMEGDYLAASYFQTGDGPENEAFVRKILERYGADRATSDMMAAAYSGVHLWAAAAAAAGDPAPEGVVAAARGREFTGPAGLIRIDPQNLHAWRPWMIGRVGSDGAVRVVARSAGIVRPEPYPGTRPRDDWERFLNDLKLKWDGGWQAPSPK
jgi:urea transport system substrate-binding protein